jgi:NodT family efflux transporter outer membrane factor (OMF) lipoprotein
MSARPILALALLATAACRVGPEHSVPEVEMPEQFTEASAPATGSPDVRWWSAFHDATLDSLVERAVAQNLDLKIAAARVREARALRAFTAGGFDPQVDASAGYSRSRASENTLQGEFLGGDTQDVWQVGFDATWEIDIFGRRDRAVEAADAAVDAAIESRRDALVTLLGEVARNYVELRGVQRQIALTRQNLASQRETAELTRIRSGAGLAGELDVARSEAQAATTASQIPALETRVRAAIHRLGVLLGTTPGALARELEPEAPLFDPPATIATGLPSELLRRRPDVRRAERELAEATAITAAATADLFPRLQLGASIGQAAESFGDLFKSGSTVWSIGGGLTAPIFHGGSLQATVEAADARRDQARFAYQQRVLDALNEVEDSLSAVARQRERVTTLQSAVDSNRRAVTLASDLYRRGLTSFFDVLDAQRALFVTESALAEGMTDLGAQTVALYKALGGGWEIGEEEGSGAQ